MNRILDFNKLLKFYLYYPWSKWWFYALLLLPNLVIISIGTIFYFQHIYVAIFSGSILIIIFFLGYQLFLLFKYNSNFNNIYNWKFYLYNYLALFLSILFYCFLIVFLTIFYFYFWNLFDIFVLESFLINENVYIKFGLQYTNWLIFIYFVIIMTIINFLILILFIKYSKNLVTYYSIITFYIIFNLFFSGIFFYSYTFEISSLSDGQLVLNPIKIDNDSRFTFLNYLFPNYYLIQFSFFMCSYIYIIPPGTETTIEVIMPYIDFGNWGWNQLIVIPYIFLFAFIFWIIFI